LRVGNEHFDIGSRFSAPDGNWYTESNRLFRHSRLVVEHDEWIEIRDVFENLASETRPLMQEEHTCRVGAAGARFRLCGVEVPAKAGYRRWGENPSAFAAVGPSAR